MPVIKSAEKKLRADKKREKNNNEWRNLLKKLLKTARKTHTREDISKATKIIDKMAKKNLIHKNKAARLKSGLSKFVKGVAKPVAKTTKSKIKSKAK